MPRKKTKAIVVRRKPKEGPDRMCGGDSESIVCPSPCSGRQDAPLTRFQSAREKEKTTIVGMLGEYELLHIFNFLCLRDLLNVSRVCKKWNTLAWRKELWSSVSLRHSTIRSCQGMLKTFNRFGTSRLDLAVMRNKPNVKATDSGVQVLTYLPVLSYVKSLRQLHIIDRFLPARVLEDVPRTLPNLEMLVVNRIVCSPCAPMQHNLQTPATLNISRLCVMKNLRQLKLKGVCGLKLPGFSFSKGLNELTKLTNLRVLSLTSLVDIPANMFDFLPSLVHVRTLRLGDCLHWDSEVYEKLGRLTGLEHLYLENSGFSPDICGALRNLTRLKTLELVIFILPAYLSNILPSMPHLHSVFLVPRLEDEMSEVNWNCLSIIHSLRSSRQLKKLRWGIITLVSDARGTDNNTESIPVPGSVSWRTSKQHSRQAPQGNPSKSANVKNGDNTSTHKMTLRSSSKNDGLDVGSKVEAADDGNLPQQSGCTKNGGVNSLLHRSDDKEVLVSVNLLNSVLKPMFPTTHVEVSRITVTVTD